MCSRDLFFRTNKESSIWCQNDHAKFVGTFHVSRRMLDGNRACSISICFFLITDVFDGRSFLICSHNQFFGTNKNWILKNGSFERAFRSWKWWTSAEFIEIKGPGEAKGQACDKKFAWMVGIWQILKICHGIAWGKVMLEIDWDTNASNLNRGHRVFSKVRWLCKERTKRCAHPTFWGLEAAKIPHFWVPKFQ